MELVTFVVGKQFIDSYDLDGIINLAYAQISDRSRDVEDELSNTDRRGEDLGRNQDFAGEQPVDEMVFELILIHSANFMKNGSSLRLARFPHDQSNSAAIWPVAAIAEKDSAQLVERKIVDRVGAIDNDDERFGRIALVRGPGGAGPGQHGGILLEQGDQQSRQQYARKYAFCSGHSLRK